MSKQESKTTVDHDEIRRWAEARGGKPASVKSTMEGKHEAGLLRIHFPKFSKDGELADITWDEFFEKFDKEKLAFLYQEMTADGETSTFNKLISR